MNLVDSSGWVHFFFNGPLAERYASFILKPDSVVTPTIVIYEVYKKLRHQDNDDQDAILAASQMRKTHVVPLTDETALAAADISLEHRLSMADAIIYATAQMHHAELVTSDTDFKNLPGVLFISPKE